MNTKIPLVIVLLFVVSIGAFEPPKFFQEIPEDDRKKLEELNSNETLTQAQREQTINEMVPTWSQQAQVSIKIEF